MPLRFLPVFVGLLTFFSVERAEAYPWLIKHNYASCGSCHADPSGGELLTLYGHAISVDVLSTKWGGDSSAAAREEERRIVAAIARAGHAKNAPKKKIAAEKVDLDEAPAPKAKPAKAAPAKAAPPAKAEAAEAAATEAAPAEAAAEAAPAGAEAAPAKAAKEPSEEDEEAAAEEETAAEGTAGAEAEASASTETSSGAEPSPFEGMGALVGPLFGVYKPSELLLLGGSWRLATLYGLDKAEGDKLSIFPMQLDMYGQYRFLKNFRVNASIGAAKVPVGSVNARAAQVTHNQGAGYNVISRTHWIGYDFGEGMHTVRLGRMNLPFGIRLSEHVMWVRDKTQTDRESDQQHGLALAMTWEKARMEVMGIAGNYQISEPFRERGYAGFGELMVVDNFAVGVSSLMTTAASDRLVPEGLKTVRSAHGLFVRSGPSEKVAFLAEVDVLTRSRRKTGYVGMLQIDTEPLHGFHAIATGEFYDMGWSPGITGTAPRTNGQGKPAMGGWLSLQWFVYTHFDVRVDAIWRADRQLMAQAHLYL